MRISAKISNKYITKGNKAIKTLYIEVKECLEVFPGDSIILNPTNSSVIEIKRKTMLMIPQPYYNLN
jgi:hypothetical protein